MRSSGALASLPSRLSRLPRNRRSLLRRHVSHPCSGAGFAASAPKGNGSRIFSVLCHFQKGQSLSDWEVSSVSSASLRPEGNFAGTVFFTFVAVAFKVTFLLPPAGFFFLCFAMKEFYSMLKRCAQKC